MTPQVTVVGGGMILHDQILPSLYQLQRLGAISGITVCDLYGRTLRKLAEAETIRRAFPGQQFRAMPALDADPDQPHPGLYAEAIAAMPERQMVVVAVPDHLHYDVILTAIRNRQHVLSVKPLVLKAAQALEIAAEARARDLLVAIEYHKRFDDRSLLARRRYRDGCFGEFKLGTACLMEKWYYRHSNFQNWCTAENSDAFTYVGCHYVDLVHFITGLWPAAVSVYGIKDRYPNGNEGFLWTDARIVWSNGACLNVQNSLSFPDGAPGTNNQGMTLYCAGGSGGGWIEHSDQYRGLRYCYTRQPEGPGATLFAEPSTDYFQYVEYDGPGWKPVGYGYRSVEAVVRAAIRVEETPAGQRAAAIEEIDRQGLLATPANSFYNELVIEAGRLSILNGGREAVIRGGEAPGVELR